jgi:hypothetical protein
MRRFVLGWKTLRHEQRLQARIVNYADDFVICCRGTAEQAMSTMRDLMSRIKLTVNENKTKLCRVPEKTFDVHSTCRREFAHGFSDVQHVHRSLVVVGNRRGWIDAQVVI